MNLLNSVSTRLGLAFGSVVLVFGAAILFGIAQLSRFDQAVTSVTGEQLEKLEVANAWIFELQESARHTRNMLILDDKDKVRQEVNATMENKAKRKEYMEQLQHLVSSTDEKNALQVVIDARAAYTGPEDDYLSQVAAGQLSQAKETLLTRARPTQLEYISGLGKFIEVEKALIAAKAAALAVSYQRARSGLLLASLAAVVIAGVLTYLIVRSIKRPLARVIEHFGEIRRGNFNEEIQVTSNDELGQVLAAMKTTQGALREAAIKASDYEGQIAAIGRVQAVIEFDLDGRIRTANENFLKTMGYSASELATQHHSLFVDSVDRASPQYRAFWERLGRGEYDAGTYKRIGRDGREVWLQATYNPILDPAGKPYKVVKYATDITERIKMREALDAAVSETQAAVQAAINGDLTSRVATAGKSGQIEALANSANALIENMMGVVAGIQHSTEQVRNSAQEISAGNLNLSQRTEEQAASLEETASSMEEMTTTVRTTADNATQARELAIAAREKANKGGEVVTAAVSAMSGINDSSNKIADIIGVIDEIAFQTNLLALNAAVEAARAGEQGRGFAVVASEVRNLAGRSATAAKEIKSLIKDSVGKVEEGSKLVDESGRALEEIGTAIKRVTEVVAEIAQASQAQAGGIEQVNKAVMHMDETTQQNAALVEQAAAASQAIVGQATELVELIARYRVTSESGVPASSGVRQSASEPSAMSDRRRVVSFARSAGRS
jgi:methyl-accepting chemotaxis protein